ncbi:hypothetical protein N0Y54_29885, partial [Nostoc punctiforme UO1]|uniref:hypothetical protein n=1 Tax=Nostoc punctiforme TaxID=272131 RepID=UPI0030AC188F
VELLRTQIVDSCHRLAPFTVRRNHGIVITFAAKPTNLVFVKDVPNASAFRRKGITSRTRVRL